MDTLGNINTANGTASVVGSGNSGGYGLPRQNGPKGLPLGGKPPGGIVIGGAGKPGTGGGQVTGNAPTGGGINGNSGSAGKPNNTGNVPWGGGRGPTCNRKCHQYPQAKADPLACRRILTGSITAVVAAAAKPLPALL